jgi:hypothetical protein
MLAELIRAPKKSERQLGQAIGISQPTASRTRGAVEGEGYVKEFTTIPNLPKVGTTSLLPTASSWTRKAICTDWLNSKAWPCSLTVPPLVSFFYTVGHAVFTVTYNLVNRYVNAFSNS